MVENHEVIYVGQVQGAENTYGLIHNDPSGTHSHFHSGMNYDTLSGYLEGVFAMPARQIELANGVPSEVRGSSLPNVEFSRIDHNTLDKLLEDSGIKNKLKFSIRLY